MGVLGGGAHLYPATDYKCKVPHLSGIDDLASDRERSLPPSWWSLRRDSESSTEA